MKQYANQAGLEDVTPHVLRHSFAKRALDSGTDLVAVATLLGHQRPETTAIYRKPKDSASSLPLVRDLDGWCRGQHSRHRARALAKASLAR